MTPTTKCALTLAAASCLTVAAAGIVPAQEGHSGHDMGNMTMKAESPSTEGYKAAMDAMHTAMMATPYTGDADIDFVRGMIPHHQGAIDMARVVLEHGKDPEIRKLAEGVVRGDIRAVELYGVAEHFAHDLGNPGGAVIVEIVVQVFARLQRPGAPARKAPPPTRG